MDRPERSRCPFKERYGLTNTEKLYCAVADVLNVDASSVNDASSPDTIPGWDSLAVVIVAFQAAFDVEFDISRSRISQRRYP